MSNDPAPKTDGTTLLLLSASPSTVKRVRVDQEEREIQAELDRSAIGRNFVVRSRPALRYSDLQYELLRAKPTILHFAGHGVEAGIVVEDEAGGARVVPGSALAELLALPKIRQSLRVVVLNACLSAQQARAIAKEIDGIVVGMSSEVSDRAAIEFARGLYGALGDPDVDLQTAFRIAKNRVGLSGLITETQTPRLFVRKGFDASGAYLRSRDPAASVDRAGESAHGTTAPDGTLQVSPMAPGDAVRPPTTRGLLWPTTPHMLTPAPRFVGRGAELEDLRQFWTAAGPGVLALEGIGGSGKTALVGRFVKEIVDADQGGPSHLFVWSFYEDKSTDGCLESLFRYLDPGADLNEKGSGWLLPLQTAMARVARPLIVLDGMELVQRTVDRPPQQPFGGLEDRQLRGLLQRLSEGIGAAKALITTRFPVPDLEDWSGFRQLDVTLLDQKSAIDVLRKHGVHGSDATLLTTVKKYGSHALTLDHFGSLVARYFDGDPAKAEVSRPLWSGRDAQAARLESVLSAYKSLLPQFDLRVLETLCVVRQAVNAEFLYALLKGQLANAAPAIMDVRESLESLREQHLVLMETPGMYTTHPAIRDFFYQSIADPRPVHADASKRLLGEDDARRAALQAQEMARLEQERRQAIREYHPRRHEILSRLLARQGERERMILLRWLGGQPRERVAELADMLVDYPSGRRPLGAFIPDPWITTALGGPVVASGDGLPNSIQEWLRTQPAADREAISRWIKFGAVMVGDLSAALARPTATRRRAHLMDPVSSEWHAMIDQLLPNADDAQVSLTARPAVPPPRDLQSLNNLEELIHHALAAGLEAEAQAVYFDRMGGGWHLGVICGEFERGRRILREFTTNIDPDGFVIYRRGVGEPLTDEEWATCEPHLSYWNAMARDNARLLAGQLISSGGATAQFLLGDGGKPFKSGEFAPRFSAFIYYWERRGGTWDRPSQSTSVDLLSEDGNPVRGADMEIDDPSRNTLLAINGPSRTAMDEANDTVAELWAAEWERRTKAFHAGLRRLDAIQERVAHSGRLEHQCLLLLVKARFNLDAKEFEAATVQADEVVRLARSAGYRLLVVDGLIEIGRIRNEAGDGAGAIAAWRESRDVARGPDGEYAWAVADATHAIGVLLAGSSPEQARTELLEALAKREAIGDSTASETRLALEGLPQ